MKFCFFCPRVIGLTCKTSRNAAKTEILRPKLHQQISNSLHSAPKKMLGHYLFLEFYSFLQTRTLKDKWTTIDRAKVAIFDA